MNIFLKHLHFKNSCLWIEIISQHMLFTWSDFQLAISGKGWIIFSSMISCKKLNLNLLQRTKIAAYILISMLILLQLFGLQMKLWLYGDSLFLCTKQNIFLKSHRNEYLCVLVYIWIRKLSKKWITKNVHSVASDQMRYWYYFRPAV